MAETQSSALEVQQKKEVAAEEEQTAAGRYYMPYTDIYEKDDALIVVTEMPGVDKAGVDVRVEDGVLHVEGRIDFEKYAGLSPVYTEYNIGHFSRRFSLSSKIDQDKISASLADGVLRIELPKAAEAQPRRIAIG